MVELLCVGAGGFVGSIARYGLSLVGTPGDLPVMTLLTNFLGAVVIGVIAGAAEDLGDDFPPNLLLFLKVGLCGGFTTFSTFSLETVNLFAAHKTGLAVAYALGSVAVCLVGVILGRLIAKGLQAAAA